MESRKYNKSLKHLELMYFFYRKIKKSQKNVTVRDFDLGHAIK